MKMIKSMGIKDLGLLEGNKIILHYWFNDNSHTMDAVIHNKCEYELLGVIKEIALNFEVGITIETKPLAEGGLRRYFKIVAKSEKKSAIITTAIITTFFTAIFITPITTSITKATEMFIERIFEDRDLKDLEKEKLKLEIEVLKQELHQKIKLIDANNQIKKRKSNFYEALDGYPKIDKVSIIIKNNDNKSVSKEHFILKQQFKEFILVTDDLEPIDVENAIIEIISPVLKKGKYKWNGIYNGEPISFDMKSNEFKTLIQSGKIEFKNGSSINCQLKIRKKVDNEGVEKIVGFDVLRVNNYFENDKPIETPEGKRHRQKEEADLSQLKLFDEE